MFKGNAHKEMRRKLVSWRFCMWVINAHNETPANQLEVPNVDNALNEAPETDAVCMLWVMQTSAIQLKIVRVFLFGNPENETSCRHSIWSFCGCVGNAQNETSAIQLQIIRFWFVCLFVCLGGGGNPENETPCRHSIGVLCGYDGNAQNETSAIQVKILRVVFVCMWGFGVAVFLWGVFFLGGWGWGEQSRE